MNKIILQDLVYDIETGNFNICKFEDGIRYYKTIYNFYSPFNSDIKLSELDLFKSNIISKLKDADLINKFNTAYEKAVAFSEHEISIMEQHHLRRLLIKYFIKMCEDSIDRLKVLKCINIEFYFPDIKLCYSVSKNEFDDCDFESGIRLFKTYHKTEENFEKELKRKFYDNGWKSYYNMFLEQFKKEHPYTEEDLKFHTGPLAFKIKRVLNALKENKKLEEV